MDENLVIDETLEVEEQPLIVDEHSVPSDEELQKRAEIAENYKIRAEKAEKENKALKANPPKSSQSADALSFIKLGKKLESYSDDEIDFAVEHAKSKDPDAILAALDDEMVQLAISAKREKVEKELKALRPSATQTDTDAPMNLEDALANASMEEKEKILQEQFGYNTTPTRRDDTVYRR